MSSQWLRINALIRSNEIKFENQAKRGTNYLEDSCGFMWRLINLKNIKSRKRKLGEEIAGEVCIGDFDEFIKKLI